MSIAGLSSVDDGQEHELIKSCVYHGVSIKCKGKGEKMAEEAVITHAQRHST